MIYLVIISFFIFLTYNSILVNRFGIPESLSDTFYLLDKKGFIFSAMLGISAMLLMLPIMELRESTFKLPEFLTVVGVMFVAVAPAFKKMLEKQVHVIGAVVAALMGLLTVILAGYIYVILIATAITMILYFILKKENTFTYFAEMVVFASIYYVLFANCLK